MSGYGVESWCLDSLQPGMYATGSMVVLQACYRRLTTPRGMLQGGDDESAYGFDLAQFVGAAGVNTSLVALPGMVRGELLKDDRVSDVTCIPSQSAEAGGGISIALVINVLLSDGSGAFSLTLGVSAVDVTILGISAP